MFWDPTDRGGSANDSTVGASVAIVATTYPIAADSAAYASRGSRGDPNRGWEKRLSLALVCRADCRRIPPPGCSIVRTWFDPAVNVHRDSLGLAWSQGCGQDVENSEELQKHKELAHPSGTSDKSTDLEKPDLLGDTSDE